jgi:hypothetical protein
VTGPPPLPRPAGPLPPFRPLGWTADLWRIQNDPTIAPRAYPTPRYRFDAPAGEYPLFYACADELGAFAEVYGERARRLGGIEGARRLLRLRPTAPLPLVDLHDIRLLHALGLDERVSIGDDYAACQAWALAFHRGWPDAAGLRYRARKAGASIANVALFLDRCAHHLAVVAPPAGPPRLDELEATVLAAADRYNLVVSVAFRTP